MKLLTFAAALGFAVIGFAFAAEPQAQKGAQKPQAAPPANPEIDMPGHLKVAAEAAKHRETRRVSEEDFIKMSAEPGTIILDARSKAMFDLMHIQGAINLSFPDIAIDSLKKTLPDKDARILIYCNNNFRNEPVAFAPKVKATSLNLSTYITLYTYGYKNVYELAPLLDPKASKLAFEGTMVKK